MRATSATAGRLIASAVVAGGKLPSSRGGLYLEVSLPTSDGSPVVRSVR